MLITTWVSTQGGGLWTAFGLYNTDPGQPGPNPTITNTRFVDAAGNTIVVPGWTAGGNDNPFISGDGAVWFVAAADTDQGVNNAASVGTTMRIAFSSADLANYSPESLVYARAHIQSFGDNGCSIKPDSRATDNLVDDVATVDARCGTTFDGGPDATIPEPITMVLLGSGLLGIGGLRLRRRRHDSLEQD
jgi:hypothetical protein